MLPGLELMGCPIVVPAQVMHHVVKIESSFNPYAIGVVGGRLVRQPRNLSEAVATARMLEQRGYNFSLGLAQVNRYNLAKYGVADYAAAFTPCTNLRAGSQILAECNQRAGGHWGRSFSCYYSGNFTTGYRHGYVQKIERSMWGGSSARQYAVGQAVPLANDGVPAPSVRRAGRRAVRIVAQPESVAGVSAILPAPPPSIIERRGASSAANVMHVPPPSQAASTAQAAVTRLLRAAPEPESANSTARDSAFVF